jgi:hypothetical protein
MQKQLQVPEHLRDKNFIPVNPFSILFICGNFAG